HLHRPQRGLDRRRRLIAVPGPRRRSLLAALVAIAFQERDHLALPDRLDHQPHAQPCDILQHVTQLTARAEQLMDLVTDALDGRYSNRHGVGLLRELVALEGTYARRRFPPGTGRHRRYVGP